MKNFKKGNFVITLLLYFIFSNTIFASVGLAEGPAIEYGLGPFGLFALLFILSMILLIELVVILTLVFNNKKKAVFKILKLNAIILSLICLAVIVIPKINKALSGNYIIYNQERLEELGSLD